MTEVLTAEAVRDEPAALTLRCATHSAGGVTTRDIGLARWIDEIVRSVR